MAPSEMTTVPSATPAAPTTSTARDRRQNGSPPEAATTLSLSKSFKEKTERERVRGGERESLIALNY